MRRSARSSFPLTSTKIPGAITRRSSSNGRWALGSGSSVADGALSANVSLLGQTIGVSELASADFGDWSCNGTTCTVDANSVALTTDTTGNYVQSIADDGQSTVTVTNGATEGGAATLRVIDVVCTDCLGATEIADSYLLNNGDTGTGLYSFANSSTSLASFGYASSTLYYGAGLATCESGNMLTWVAGYFGCEADDTGEAGGAEPFPDNATSTRLTFNDGLALATGEGLYFQGASDENWRMYSAGENIFFQMSGSPGGRYFNFGNNDGDTSVFQIEGLNGSTTQKGIANLMGGASTTLLSAGTIWGNLVGNVIGNLTGNADTATALAANGTNCSAGQAAGGVGANGNAEDCTDYWTEAENTDAAFTPQSRTLTVAGTANQITLSAGAQDLSANRTWTLSLPNLVVFPSNASSTLFSTGYASSTLYYGAGLANCNTGNMLTWTDGRFGCEDDTTGGGGGGAEPFPNNATSSLLSFTSGLLSTASSTIGAGTQAGGLTISGGATTTGSHYFGSTIAPVSSDGAALGNTSLLWSDLFMADGGLIDFNNGGGSISYSSSQDAISVSNAVLRTSTLESLASSGTLTIGRTGTNGSAPALVAGNAPTGDADGRAITLTGGEAGISGGEGGNIVITTGNSGASGDRPGDLFFNLGTPRTRSGRFAFATSTPFALLSLHANAVDTNTMLFAVGSSTASATTTLFTIDNTGTTTALKLVASSAIDIAGTYITNFATSVITAVQNASSMILSGTWDFSGATVKQHTYPAFVYATSTAWTGTTTIPLGPAYTAESWSGVKCFSDTGTLNVSFYDGSNRMNLFNASTTVGSVTLSTNNTFTASEKRYVDIGTPVSSPTRISCTVDKIVNN